nr:KGG domain-containing protein [Novacetimonas cocois]
MIPNARPRRATRVGSTVPANFANDPERAAEAGRKGGLHSHDKS